MVSGTVVEGAVVVSSSGDDVVEEVVFSTVVVADVVGSSVVVELLRLRGEVVSETRDRKTVHYTPKAGALTLWLPKCCYWDFRFPCTDYHTSWSRLNGTFHQELHTDCSKNMANRRMFAREFQ